LDKTKITNARTEMAHFLGTDIRITPLDKRPTSLVTRGGAKYLAKSATHPQLLAPINKLVKKLITKGLAKEGGAPTRWTKQIWFGEEQIVARMKSIWLGILNYYSFADNRASLSQIFYIIKYSCVLTLASKLKLGTMKKVFEKFGEDLAIKVGDKTVASFENPASLGNIKKFHNSALTLSNPLARIEKLCIATHRTRKLFGQACTVCKSTKEIQAHHVRKLRDSTKKIKMDYLTSMMSRMNRKQIPLCKTCHLNYHKGILTIPKDNLLSEVQPKQITKLSKKPEPKKKP